MCVCVYVYKYNIILLEWKRELGRGMKNKKPQKIILSYLIKKIWMKPNKKKVWEKLWVFIREAWQEINNCIIQILLNTEGFIYLKQIPNVLSYFMEQKLNVFSGLL